MSGQAHSPENLLNVWKYTKSKEKFKFNVRMRIKAYIACPMILILLPKAPEISLSIWETWRQKKKKKTVTTVHMRAYAHTDKIFHMRGTSHGFYEREQVQPVGLHSVNPWVFTPEVHLMVPMKGTNIMPTWPTFCVPIMGVSQVYSNHRNHWFKGLNFLLVSYVTFLHEVQSNAAKWVWN